jgi:hypothetical protein
MSIQSLTKQFVEMCNKGQNFEVMKTMYAPDIVSVEGDGKATVGQGPVIEKSAVWAAGIEIHGEKVLGPYFNGGDQFAVHFTFEITRKATNERVTIQEIGLYTVKGDKITREEFFYDGVH